MRTLLVVLALCAGCGGASPCDPTPCAVSATPKSCDCGARFCTVCVCDGPQCAATSQGERHAVDCSTGAVLEGQCLPDGGAL